LLPATVLALAPKCLFCVAAYTGLGVALRLGSPEFCDVTAGGPTPWHSPGASFGLACGLGAFAFLASRRCGQPAARRPRD